VAEAAASRRPAEATRSEYVPPFRIDVTTRPGVERVLSTAELARVATRTLLAAGAPAPASLGLILTGDRELARLNRQHLGHRGPTDVLSFPLLPAGVFPAHDGQLASTDERRALAFVGPPGRRVNLGDVVVSIERAATQARQGRGGQTGSVRWPIADELRLLVTHGVLHVCGWDHAVPAEEAAMRGLERALLGIQPPGLRPAPGG
jgi:probable rRNA maturation factor